jgi:small multidrug resistance pump
VPRLRSCCAVCRSPLPRVPSNGVFLYCQQALHGVRVRMTSWLYLMIAIVAEVIGTSALRSSDGFTRTVPSVVVIVGYSTAFYFLSLTLKTIPVGVAYAVWSGIGIVLISAVGWVVFGQKLDLGAIAGIALITAGVVILNVFSKSTAQ